MALDGEVLGCLAVALWQSLPEIEKGRKKRRLDALGLTAFAFMMASFLLFVDSAGKEDGVDNPIALAFGAAFVAFAIAFVLTEIYWTKGPMIPLSLFSKGQVGPYFAVQMLLLIAQFTLVSNIAIYFARTENASNSIAALHILPAPVGNAIGALVAGKIINRYVLPL
ncbi:hypothetical protein MMC21_004844 [Puttea exsequens]|nr:hypothetical protein [Puttea exsequens]